MRETRNCQNCKQNFVIEAEDFTFYEKIKVPPPTWCPECRFKRRMSWRNAWHLFKKTDALTGEKIFSLFPEESPIKIYERDYWWSDKWNAEQYGRDFDFRRTFFEQFRDLMHEVPFPAHSVIDLSNCQYCTNANNMKNCYLVRAAANTEDSAYLIWDNGSKRCMDSHMTEQCEMSYGNVNATRCFKTLFCSDCEDCVETILCKDCVGCSNCFGCVGLRNKSYHFFNERLSKEDYVRKLTELNLGSAQSFSKAEIRARDFWLKFPRKYLHGRQNVDVSGDYIYESKNAKQCYRVFRCEDVKFCQNILDGPVKDCYDYSNWGDNNELLYECLICGKGSSRVKFCAQCYLNDRDLEYCIFCHDSSDLFGCVGLRNKQYCILNKQYSKNDYRELVSKIKKHMTDLPYRDRAGNVFAYGEFFPPELSPFPYQVTEAYEPFPMTNEDAAQRGFSAYDVKREEHNFTLPAADIPDHIREAQDTITDGVIGCQHDGKCAQECTKAFRIIKEELEFCRRLSIPLPRLCPNCRHYERLAFRNSPRFFNRVCGCAGKESQNGVYQNTASHFHGQEPCPNEFQTSYAPQRPEIVYCERCYQAEVV